ncbi:MAG: hypothetical protein E7371_01550 [Clostridiales bacterium]|nr:hypothetical protein [Clostridiales bacterium]
MRKTAKKIFSLVAVATLLTSAFAMSACGDGYKYFKPANNVNYTESETNGIDNGGFSVEKDGYVYFINGKESHTAENEYGNVEKGSLMRIKKDDLTAGKYDNAEMVIPMLFVAQNYNAGIFIYGDYVYYATPTTAKNMQGEVSNTYLDFKSAKLDGTEVMQDCYFRLSSNSTNYRYVAVGEGENQTVYCVYEESGALKSFNTKKGTTSVLAKGGTYMFNSDDLSNPYVYYTMGVTYNVDSAAPVNASYNQVYRVRADATAEVDAENASYAVKDGRAYDFDKAWMEKENKKAKDEAKKANQEYTPTYDFDDYSTYPYVNLGELVMNGVGKNYAGDNYSDTKYNDDQTKTVTAADCQEFTGFTYTLSRYENGGIYYTKANDTKLYYLAENDERTPIEANKDRTVVTSKLSTELQGKALFEYKDGAHTYLYIENDKIKKGSTSKEGEETKAITLCDAPASATLWTTENGVVYCYAAGTNPVTSAASTGMQITMIDYTGADEVYQNLPSLVAEDKYKPVTINYVDFVAPDSWYKPEMYDGVLMYLNAQTVDATANNYVYATKIDLGTVTTNNEKYEKAYETMGELTEKDTIKKAMTYYYYEGEEASTVIDELKTAKLYTEDEYKVFTDYVEAAKEFGTIENADANGVYAGIGLVGKKTQADTDALAEAWRSTLPAEEDAVEEETSWGTLEICLVVAGSVLVVAAAVSAAIIVANKKKAEREEAEATVNAYKRKKIDTTDDKTIDVYADEVEETEEAQAETVEETTEEPVVAEVSEEVVEETTEEVTVETVEEKQE